MNGIDTIILDLGAVIWPFERERSEEAFREIKPEGFDENYDRLKEEGFFERYETGELTTDEFLGVMEEWFGVGRGPVIDAWNKLFFPLPPDHLDVLRRLAERYRLFLLSNTNELHMQWIFRQLEEEHGGAHFGKLFERLFLSYELGLRKPDEDIYHRVREETGLEPRQFVFVDDLEDNADAAQRAGWQVIRHRANAPLPGGLADFLR